MGVGPARPAAEPLESAVVQPAEKGLEEQHGQDYEADDGMGVGLGRLELRGDVSTREAREAELEALVVDLETMTPMEAEAEETACPLTRDLFSIHEVIEDLVIVL